MYYDVLILCGILRTCSEIVLICLCVCGAIDSRLLRFMQREYQQAHDALLNAYDRINELQDRMLRPIRGEDNPAQAKEERWHCKTTLEQKGQIMTQDGHNEAERLWEAMTLEERKSMIDRCVDSAQNKELLAGVIPPAFPPPGYVSPCDQPPECMPNN